MRYKTTICILPGLVLGWALLGAVCLSVAAESRQSPPVAGATGYLAPEELAVYYETEGDYFLGYRLLSSKDSLKAAEYIYPHSSLTFGVDLLSCPLPYRYHMNAEFLSNYDFYADAGFAYNDLVLFRDILVGAHHNLNHLDYQHAGEPPGLVYTDRDPGGVYSVDFVSNLMSLRFKAPDFPFHTFMNHRHVELDGRVQQRFLLGYYSDANKVSESRDINWKSNALKLGANSHAGPVEIEYALDLHEFDPGHNNILFDPYPAAAGRPADIYPHNVVPETESAAHSVKLHSSYTGGLVAAASLGNLYQKNNYSLTESTTWKGAVDLSWIPDPMLGLFFKFRHRDLEMDNPEVVTLTGQSNTINYSVRQGISSTKDDLSLSARYKPWKALSLLGTYEFSHLERQDVAAWRALTGQSNMHRLDLMAHLNPTAAVKLTANYEYKHYNQPDYNSTPENANKWRLTTTYTPLSWLSLYLEYILTVTERDALHYLNTQPAVLLTTGARDDRSDQCLVSLTTGLSPELSLTASWFFQRWDVNQDLAYGKWVLGGGGDLPFIDAGVPYTDEFHSFSLALSYIPRPDITLVADLTHTISEGETGYDDVVGGAPFSLSSFSALKASETTLALELAKKLSSAWEVRLKSHLNIYNDRAYDLLDGNVFTTTFNVKRYF